MGSGVPSCSYVLLSSASTVSQDAFATRPQTDLRAEETIRGVAIYLLMIGDRVSPCLVSSLGDFAGAHFLALSLAQRREWLRLARPLRLTAS